MADHASDDQKNKTARTAPAEVDHAEADKFLVDQNAEIMPADKTEQRNNDIDKNGKNVSAGDQMKQAAVKGRNQKDEEDRCSSHIAL